MAGGRWYAAVGVSATMGDPLGERIAHCLGECGPRIPDCAGAFAASAQAAWVGEEQTADSESSLCGPRRAVGSRLHGNLQGRVTQMHVLESGEHVAGISRHVVVRHKGEQGIRVELAERIGSLTATLQDVVE